MKGETAGRDRRASRGRCARARCPLSRATRRRRHLRHRRRRRGHLQHLDRRRRSSWRRAACRVAKHGNRSVVEPLRQRRRVRGARRPRRRRRRRSSSAASPRPGIGFFFAPTFHPSMRHAGGAAPRARRPDGVQPARPADQSGRRARASWSACRGRSSPSSLAALPALLGVAARLGRARRGRHRRDLDRRATRRVAECRGRRRSTRSTCIPSDVGLPRRRPATLRGGDAAENARDHAARCSPARAGRARDVVLLNAGAALVVAGRAADLREGAAQAAARHRRRPARARPARARARRRRAT